MFDNEKFTYRILINKWKHSLVIFDDFIILMLIACCLPVTTSVHITTAITSGFFIIAQLKFMLQV